MIAAVSTIRITARSQDYPYAAFIDIKFPPLTVVDVPALVGAVTHPCLESMATS
jgi:hypothetical protein